jgi:hypothetical protein
MPDRRPFNDREREVFDLLVNEIRRLIQEIESVEENNPEEFGAFREQRVSNPITDLRFALNSLLEILSEFLEYRDSERALQALTNWSLVNGQAESLSSQLETLSTSAPASGIRQAASSLVHKLSGWFSYLKGAIQGISAKLWSLLSTYLKLKEWSIKGTVTSPALTNLFSFSGAAELQLTFGP